MTAFLLLIIESRVVATRYGSGLLPRDALYPAKPVSG
jgi:hypothetical protein